MSAIRHVFRAARTVLRDERVPKPVRWLGALALLPIPGPIDEAILALVVIVLALGYRTALRDAWTETS